MKTLKRSMMMAVLVVIYCLLAISCMTVDRRGAFLIDTPKAIKEHNIIEDKILPYIAEVLEYNNPSGTNNPQAAQYFHTVKTANNMNYDKFVDCQDYALLFYALCKRLVAGRAAPYPLVIYGRCRFGARQQNS